MLKIGYARLGDEQLGDEHLEQQLAELERLGCQVIRTEEAYVDGAPAPVLAAILDFIAEGDQLIVTRLEHLATTSRQLLDVVARLQARGASLYVSDADLSTEGDGGRALRAVLEAVGQLEPTNGARRRRSGAEAHEIRALRRAGVGPVEIARRLGVSRMTVWRKLREMESEARA
ncbi:site-specific recombinase, DNA invertase Pin-like protein [Phenylobacterium zucineum HLK1]|uniref:Site-specific recombinase, DNA invertase Pin-like protein n=1 Tax=Phenylobacterium zucineum (strain HLK1) TaxID=450851 RepID=B4RGV3_PHEZH|nr:recombinase family protein [Phenylobacterium zucineum]ACG77319.1 site-specific recombinase, DNA invertase Pin-like protein [Phenylobacterium zucineum HLK1]